jgi:hypothetical protein
MHTGSNHFCTSNYGNSAVRDSSGRLERQLRHRRFLALGRTILHICILEQPRKILMWTNLNHYDKTRQHNRKETVWARGKSGEEEAHDQERGVLLDIQVARMRRHVKNEFKGQY